MNTVADQLAARLPAKGGAGARSDTVVADGTGLGTAGFGRDR